MAALRCDFAPPPVGTVYGTLLNHRAALAALGDAVHAAALQGAAARRRCCTSSRATPWPAHGAAVAVPAGVPALEIGATLGIVIGRTACRVRRGRGAGATSPATLIVQRPERAACDASTGPSLRFKARDGFLPARAAWSLAARHVRRPDALDVRVRVDGQLVQRTTTAGMHARRGAADRRRQRLHDAGARRRADAGRGGRRAAGRAPGRRSRIDDRRPRHAANTAGGRGGGGMKTRAASPTAGAVHDAVPHARRACSWPTAACWPKTQVVWLPPFEVGTIIALGLNYADHVKELAKELDAQRQGRAAGLPEGPERADRPPRPHAPAGRRRLHALRVRAGGGHRPHGAQRVKRADAMAHVAGYTVANDYAVRDYLENWYRPNLRVKNRDGGTVLGPWLVDAADVPDPHALALRTLVNGKLTQQGNTRDMIYDVPGADRIPEQLHDAAARRRDPHRHARRRGQRQRRRRGRDARSTASAGCVNTIVADDDFGR